MLHERIRAALLAGAGTICLTASEARAVDSQAEIQINLCSNPAQLVRALQLGGKGKPTTVWLFDTPALDLDRRGLRLRLRERGGQADLTLKAAGQDCATVDASLLGREGKCEADLHGDAFDDVISLVRTLDRGSLSALLAPDTASGAPLVHALSIALAANQRTLLAAQPGADASAPLPSGIKRLGPSSVRAYRAAGEPYVVEVWTLPGGEQFVELSQKVPRAVAITRRAELESGITAAGVSICADQTSQARHKLDLLVR